MQGKKHYSEKLFTHFQLSDRAPNIFYRRLKKILALDWLYGATVEYYGSEGQQSIDPVVFMKFMLIGESSHHHVWCVNGQNAPPFGKYSSPARRDSVYFVVQNALRNTCDSGTNRT